MSWWQEQRRAWAHDWGGVAGDTNRSVGMAVRFFAIVTRLAAYAALFLALYIFWPTTNIFDKPLGPLTLGEILTTAAFIGMALLLLRGLFNPSQEPEIRRAWAWLGGFLIAAGLVLVAFLAR